MADFDTNPRRQRVGWFALELAALVWLSIVAASVASASKITDLRIGAHDDFTRVVFELDRPTGYRIERASPTAGVWELVVSLDATSLPRKVQSQKGLIGLVLITPEGSGSVARIQLKQDGLSLKEMILANPPRIVLDVLSPTRASAMAAKATPKPADVRPTASAAESKPAPKVTAAAPTPSPTPSAAPVEPPAAEPLAAEAQPDFVPTAVRTAGLEDEAKAAADSLDPSLAPDPARGSDPAPPVAGALAAAPTGAGGTAPRREMPSERSAPVPAAERVARRAEVPPIPAAEVDADSGIGFGKIGMGIAGLLLLGGAVVYLRRRNSAEIEDDFDEGVEVGGPIGLGSDNPFANLRSKDDRQPVLSAPHAADGGTGHFEIGDLDDDDEKKVEATDAPLIGDSGITFGGGETRVQGPRTSAGAGDGLEDEGPGDEETMRIIREIEQRMASLESRLDEAVDARERLERQVAAQTEELRVQRAAIARTQRAVRNMNRPDEEGPTEPALRDNP